MSYTIKELLDSNRFPKMDLISDNSGIDREIKSYGTLKQSGEKECQSNPEAE